MVPGKSSISRQAWASTGTPKWLIVLVLTAATPLLSYVGSSTIPIPSAVIDGMRFGLLGANLCLSTIIIGACFLLSRTNGNTLPVRLAVCLLFSDSFAFGYGIFVDGDLGLGWAIMRTLEFAGLTLFAAVATRTESPGNKLYSAAFITTAIVAFAILPLHNWLHIIHRITIISPCALLPLFAVLAAGLWAIPSLRVKNRSGFVDALWIACLPGFVGALHTSLVTLSANTGDALLGHTFVLIGRLSVIGGLVRDAMQVDAEHRATQNELASHKAQLYNHMADNQNSKVELTRRVEELRHHVNEVGRLAQALDQLDQLVAIVAPTGQILRHNKRFAEFIGSSAPHQKIDTLLTDPKDFDAILHSLLRRKEWEGKIEVRNVPNQTTAMLSARAFRFEQDSPEQPYVVGLVITDERDVNDVRQQNQRLRWLMGSAPDLLVELSADGKIYYANPIALSSFPLLLEQGLECDLLRNVMNVVDDMRSACQTTIVRDLTVNTASYHQTISIETAEQRIVVASQDVSEYRDQALISEMIGHRLQWLYELDSIGDRHPYEVIARALSESCNWFKLDQVVLDQSDNDAFICIYAYPETTLNPGAPDLMSHAFRQALRENGHGPFAIETGEDVDDLMPVFGIRIYVESMPWGALYYSARQARSFSTTDHHLLEMLARWLGSQIARLQGSGKHDAFFNQTNVMLCTCRPNGAFRNANPAMLGTFDTNLNDMVGRTFETIAAESSRNEIRKAWEQVAAGASVDGLEFEAILPGDRTSWLKWWAVPVPGAQLAYCTLVDVSLDHRRAEKLRKSHDTVVSTVEFKSDILAKVSHEIKSPLNGVIGMVELLEETNLAGNQHHYVEQMRLSAEMVLQLTNTLLDFSRLESSRLELREAPFDLRHATEAAITMYETAADAKGIALIMRYPAQMPRFFIGDGLRIQQIVANLVGNAVKFTDIGQVLISVETEGPDKGKVGRARITVQDTGCGIPHTEHDRVFQSFHQIGEHNIQGTGLGLAIVRQLVEMMGGTLSLESEPGQGSCFKFELPLRKTDAAPGSTTTICDLNIRRALLLMGDPLSAQVIRNTLDDVSLVCDEADTPRKALKAIEVARKEESPYRLIVVDENLTNPGPDEFAQLVRANKKNDATHLVRCSLSRRKSEIPDDLGHFSAWIISPITPGRIGRILAEIMAPQLLEDQGERIPQTIHLPRPARILIVEDSTVSIEVLHTLLQPTGAAIDNARDGTQAVELACRHKYDLIFMDCNLPKMDGFEATRSIRKLEKGKRHTPVIAVTAGSRSRDREKCEIAGMDAFLEKPIRRRRVNRILERFIVQRDFTTFVDGDSTTETISSLPVDVQRAAKEIGVKHDMYVRILHMFTGSLDEHLAMLDDAFTARDAEQLALSAHKLGGSSANLRIYELKNICGRIENLAGERNWEALESELEALENHAKSVIRYSEELSRHQDKDDDADA